MKSKARFGVKVPTSAQVTKKLDQLYHFEPGENR